MWQTLKELMRKQKMEHECQNSNIQISINSKEIELVENIKHLGIIIEFLNSINIQVTFAKRFQKM